MGSFYTGENVDYGLCDTIPYTNSTGSAVNGGTVAVVGGKVGMVFDDVLDTETTRLVVSAPAPGIAKWPKATGFATVIGDPVHHNILLGSASNDPTDPVIGHYLEAAASGATTVRIALTNEQAISADAAAVVYKDTQLTAAQVKALAAANIELVPAPDAGFAAVAVGVHLFLDHGGVDFVQTNDTDQLALRYSAGAEIAEIGTQAQCVSFLEASADAALYSPVPAIAGGMVPVAATAIDLDNNGAAEYTTGDGTLSVRVYYRIVPMIAFT